MVVGGPVFKTRALARGMIEGGKMHYNGQRTKPGKQGLRWGQLSACVGDFDEKVVVLWH